MKIALFYYDGFAEFEAALVGLLFREHERISVALDEREYRSVEGQRFCVDQALEGTDTASIDRMVIPGGNPEPLLENKELKEFMEGLVARKKLIAGICGGAALMAGLGLLRGKKCMGGSSGLKPGDTEFAFSAEADYSDAHVVVDGNFITAQGQAYAEFAVELARQRGCIQAAKSMRRIYAGSRTCARRCAASWPPLRQPAHIQRTEWEIG
jgi:putative intracellular protease/amidase